jgi:predicted small secreted protein
MVLVAGLVASAFAGCNTLRGVGKDIERGGQKIQEATD